jgi:hypothetical protein
MFSISQERESKNVIKTSHEAELGRTHICGFELSQSGRVGDLGDLRDLRENFHPVLTSIILISKLLTSDTTHTHPKIESAVI